jgi:hypothetical protein
MDEYGNYHARVSEKLREAKILAKYVESGIRSASGVKVVQVDNEIRAIDWGRDSDGESWCEEIDLEQAMKLIRKMAKWCVNEGTVLSPWRAYTVDEVRPADSDFKCWKRIDRGSVEVFIAREFVQQVFKD